MFNDFNNSSVLSIPYNMLFHCTKFIAQNEPSPSSLNLDSTLSIDVGQLCFVSLGRLRVGQPSQV